MTAGDPEASRHKLKALWHPVAYSREIGRDPVSAILLEEPLVLWRGGDGRVQAMRDLCLHRGAALSLGQVIDDTIACPYHGWRYAPDGRCVRMPQLSDQSQIPPKARVDVYACQERYGIVWVALASPAAWPLPDVQEPTGPGWRWVPTGPFAWACDAARQIENFTDFGHFAFVHPYLLGDPERTVVPRHTVTRREHVLHYAFERPEAPSHPDYPIFPVTAGRIRHTAYELHLPYTIITRMTWERGESLIYVFASQPISPNAARGYCMIARNYNLDQPDALWQRFEEVVFSQDQRVVESQRPHQVPFDLSAELHVKFDAVAVAYRRAMQEYGLGQA